MEKKANEKRLWLESASHAKGPPLLMHMVEAVVGNYVLFPERDEDLGRFFFVAVLTGLDTASISVKGCNL